MNQALCRLSFVAHLLVAPAYAGAYFVATTGSDSNPGTQGAPFLHLSKAAAAARAGDIVLVMDGTYDNEGVVANGGHNDSVVTMTNSGSAGAPITIMAQNRGKAILNAYSSTPSSSLPGCHGAWAYFNVASVHYVVIQGFVIENACEIAVRANGSSTHDITLRWNEIKNIGNYNNAGTGVTPQGAYVSSGGYNFTFDGNIFHDIGGGTNVNQQHGIYTGGSNITIVNNIFYNQTHGWDIQTAGGTNIYIANNTFAFPNPNRSGQIILWDDGNAGSLGNVTIRNNIFYSPLTVAVVTLLSAPISGSCAIDHNMTNSRSIFDGGSSCSLGNNSINTDPKLVNTSVAPYNFHLQSSSSAIGAGIPVPNLTSDFNGAPRSTGSVADLGAYAFLPATIAPIAAVKNAASLLNTPVAPGQIVSIFGSGIGIATGAGASLDASGMVNTILAGTRVLFDGVPAPMIYASALYVTAIVPYAVASQTTTCVEVEFNGAKTPGFDLQVADSAPGIFTASSSGLGQGSILNQDLSPNSAANPAAKGSIVVIYGTGEGQTYPSGIDGLVEGAALLTPVLAVSVFIGGQATAVSYAGSAPGLVCGVFQVDALIPDGITSGDQVPVVLIVGNSTSAPGVTLAVR